MASQWPSFCLLPRPTASTAIQRTHRFRKSINPFTLTWATSYYFLNTAPKLWAEERVQAVSQTLLPQASACGGLGNTLNHTSYI